MSAERDTWLAHEAYLDAFAADGELLARAAARAGLAARVPTCPQWDVLDLVRHCADVFSHKTQVLRSGRRPEPGEWLLAESLPADQALTHLQQVSGELAAALVATGPDAETWVWMDGESTAGAWARRMAHEMLVHRVDAQVAAGDPVTAAAPGLAEDGVHEVLTWFAGDPGVVADAGAGQGAPGVVRVSTGSRSWLVDLADGAHAVRGAGEDGEGAAASLAGEELAVDLALWGRLLPGDAVHEQGDPAVLQRLLARLALATR